MGEEKGEKKEYEDDEGRGKEKKKKYTFFTDIFPLDSLFLRITTGGLT